MVAASRMLADNKLYTKLEIEMHVYTERERERVCCSRMSNLGAGFEFPNCLLLKVSGPAVGQQMPSAALL